MLNVQVAYISGMLAFTIPENMVRFDAATAATTLRLMKDRRVMGSLIMFSGFKICLTPRGGGMARTFS